MKAFTRFASLLLCILLVACASKKHAVTSTTTTTTTTTVVSSETTTVSPSSQDNKKSAEAKQASCITSKIRLDLDSGGKNTSLGGMLRMKRDEVIQLSLVTFGILEVGRIEMTPDYFMLIDKVNRQYMKAAYSEVSFLRDADIDFRTLQAFFWDEHASYLSEWERSEFVNIGGRSLPTKHNITIPTRNKTIKAELKLSNINTDCEWEKRTEVPSRYEKVSVDEAISRIMKL